jgi:hypothetical protein
VNNVAALDDYSDGVFIGRDGYVIASTFCFLKLAQPSIIHRLDPVVNNAVVKHRQIPLLKVSSRLSQKEHSAHSLKRQRSLATFKICMEFL